MLTPGVLSKVRYLVRHAHSKGDTVTVLDSDDIKDVAHAASERVDYFCFVSQWSSLQPQCAPVVSDATEKYKRPKNR